MKIERRFWLVVGIWILLLVGKGQEGFAREHDFAGWSTVKFTHPVNERFQLIGMTGFRIRESFRVADRIRLNVGGRYKLYPSLSVEGAYEVHYSHLGGGEWEFRHRYYAGFLVPVDISDFRVTWRERFQQTFIAGDAETLLRSKLQFSYGRKRWRVSPFVGIEMFQPIGEENFFTVAQMRYRSGVHCKLTSGCSLYLYYCRQHTDRRNRDILGVELSINF